MLTLSPYNANIDYSFIFHLDNSMLVPYDPRRLNEELSKLGQSTIHGPYSPNQPETEKDESDS